MFLFQFAKLKHSTSKLLKHKKPFIPQSHCSRYLISIDHFGYVNVNASANHNSPSPTPNSWILPSLIELDLGCLVGVAARSHMT